MPLIALQGIGAGPDMVGREVRDAFGCDRHDREPPCAGPAQRPGLLACFEIEDNPSIDFVTLAVKLAETPCSPLKYDSRGQSLAPPAACHFVIDRTRIDHRIRPPAVQNDGEGHRLPRWRSPWPDSPIGSGEGRDNPSARKDGSVTDGSSLDTRSAPASSDVR